MNLSIKKTKPNITPLPFLNAYFQSATKQIFTCSTYLGPAEKLYGFMQTNNCKSNNTECPSLSWNKNHSIFEYLGLNSIRLHYVLVYCSQLSAGESGCSTQCVYFY